MFTFKWQSLTNTGLQNGRPLFESTYVIFESPNLNHVIIVTMMMKSSNLNKELILQLEKKGDESGESEPKYSS